MLDANPLEHLPEWRQFLAQAIWISLNDKLAHDRDIALDTVCAWLEHHGAGHPSVALMVEAVRGDAQLWAISAQQPELEAYVAAGLLQLEKSPIADRAAKRLAALGYKHMSPQSRAAFVKWIETQQQDQKDDG